MEMKKIQLFTRSVKRKTTGDPTKLLALQTSRDITGSKNVKVKKRNVPKPLVKYIEKNMRMKFKKRPKLYTYEPKKGHKFKKKTMCGEWDGASITRFDIDSAKVKDTIIILPKSHYKDKRLKENVLTHEIAETLAGQHSLIPGRVRRRSEINNFEHAVI